MYKILLHAHSGLRWVVLILVAGAIVKSIIGLSSGRPYNGSDNRLGLLSMIFVHLQLLLGFGIYFISPIVKIALEDGMGAAMKDPVQRFWLVEHLLGMIIGIALITIGRIVSKKAAEDRAKFKKTLVYFSLGLLAIIASVPWPFREALGKGWF